jgi:hypothetical protein
MTMVRRFLPGERRIKPVRTMSIALGALGLLMGWSIWVFMQTSPAPSIFKYAIITLPMEVWCIGFFAAGVLILGANLRLVSIEIAHSFGAFFYTWWGVVLTVAAANPGVVTSGYSFLCLIAAIAHWVCVAYWNWERVHHAVME